MKDLKMISDMIDDLSVVEKNRKIYRRHLIKFIKENIECIREYSGYSFLSKKIYRGYLSDLTDNRLVFYAKLILDRRIKN